MKRFLVRAYAIAFSIAIINIFTACSGDDDDGDDTTPAAFYFLDQYNVGIDTYIESNTVSIQSINVETDITIENGEYSIDGASYTDEDGTINSGQSVSVRIKSADTLYTTSSTTLTVGNTSDTFTIRTVAIGLNAQGSFKNLAFSWPTVTGASYYKLLQKAQSGDGFSQYGSNFSAASIGTNMPVAVHRFDWLGAEFLLEACTNSDCSTTDTISVYDQMHNAIGYIKSPNTEAQDHFGIVAISADGKTLAVAAPGEDSNANGINGDTGNNSANGAGAVFIYVQESDFWRFQAYIKASHSDAEDGFGTALSLSSDGNTLAVGAPFEDSASTDIDGDASDNSLTDAGAVYLYRRSGENWLQQSYIKASNPGADDQFGFHLKLSDLGSTLAVGAPGEDSGSQLIDGDGTDDSAVDAGAVYVFSAAGDSWQQQAYIKAPNAEADDLFGRNLSLTANGNVLAIGAQAERSNAIGVGGDQTDNAVELAGAVYLFARTDSSWVFSQYIKSSNTRANQKFGGAVSISADGTALAIGAIGEASASIGINGDQNDFSSPASGAVYLFGKTNGNWGQMAYIKAASADSGDQFGNAVAINATADLLVVGAKNESGSAEGTDGNEHDNAAATSGAVYVFEYNDSSWSQLKYVKASNTEAGDQFGYSLSLDAAGNSLAVGAISEQSDGTGIDADQNNNDLPEAGAVYLY